MSVVFESSDDSSANEDDEFSDAKDQNDLETDSHE
jgi:hypothetical protein